MAMCLPVPLFAATGLTVPLPSSAYRLAGELVVGIEALTGGRHETISVSSAVLREAGAITPSSGERAAPSGALHAPALRVSPALARALPTPLSRIVPAPLSRISLRPARPASEGLAIVEPALAVRGATPLRVLARQSVRDVSLPRDSVAGAPADRPLDVTADNAP